MYYTKMEELVMFTGIFLIVGDIAVGKNLVGLWLD